MTKAHHHGHFTTSEASAIISEATVQKLKKKKKKKSEKKEKGKATKQQALKRKRGDQQNRHQNDLSKSLSQVSIGSPVKKKMKRQDEQQEDKQKQSSKYLKMPKKLLFRSLRLQLNHPLKKLKERQFILSRLSLWDRQYCLQLDLKLYQYYLSEGKNQKMWPEYLRKLVESDMYVLVGISLNNMLKDLKQSDDRCTADLVLQSRSCPSTMSLSDIDGRLQEFARLHHLDLNRKVNYLMGRFKDEIRENDLASTLFSQALRTEHRQSIRSLMELRDQQMQAYEKLIMFETRILCRALPQSINKLDKLMPPELTAINADPTRSRTAADREAFKQHRKQIVELKRDMLHDKLAHYENIIEENEISYQKELFRFEYELCEEGPTTCALMKRLEAYLDQRTNKRIREILHKETEFRVKLKYPRHHRKSIRTNRQAAISVYPEAIVETSENLFTEPELALLSSSGGPSYIRPNQSFLYKKKKSAQYTQKEYEAITNKVAKDLQEYFHVPSKALEVRRFADELKSIFYQQTGHDLCYVEKYRSKRDI
ncbi:unnamed protein product, partial [Rotaria socialis]